MFEKSYVTKFDTSNNDLTVVNSARVSLDKRSNKLDKDDVKLIDYLIRNRHISPFFHNRFAFRRTMKMEDYVRYVDTTQDDQFKRHIQAINDSYVEFLETGSLFSYLKQMTIFPEVYKHIYDHCPVSVDAYQKYYHCYQTLNNIESKDVSIDVYSNEYTNHPFFSELRPIHFTIEMPIFIARQYFRHAIGFARNEVSRRYVSDDVEFFDLEMRTKPEKSIKQGSSSNLADLSFGCIMECNHHESMGKHLYEHLIDCYDVAPECARAILPQNMMTKFIETASLRSYFRMISLREDSHAQKEIREYANAITKMIAKELKITELDLSFMKNEYDKGFSKSLTK